MRLGSKFSFSSNRDNEKPVNVMGTGTAFLETVQRIVTQAGRISTRHRVSRTGIAYYEQAQRIRQKRARKFKVATRVQIHVLKRDFANAK